MKKKTKGDIEGRSLKFGIFAVTSFLNSPYVLRILIFNILSSSYISAMFFISVVRKLSVDLRPQKSGLKGVYSLKFFYLDEDEKSFFTQWYANGKDVIVCEHENSEMHFLLRKI